MGDRKITILEKRASKRNQQQIHKGAPADSSGREETTTPMHRQLERARADSTAFQSLMLAAMAPNLCDSEDDEGMKKLIDTPEAKRLAKESFYHLLEQNESYKSKIGDLERKLMGIQNKDEHIWPDSKPVRQRLEFGRASAVEMEDGLLLDEEAGRMLTETEKRLALLQARMDQLSFIIAN